MLKVLLKSVPLFLVFVAPQLALSANKITSIAVKRTDAGVMADIEFEKSTSAKSLKPIFERNFVQFALKSTKMDSALIRPVSESQVQKLFAYPYTADTARLRLILKSESAWAKGRVSVWNNNPKSIRIFIKEGKAIDKASRVADVETNSAERSPQNVSGVKKGIQEQTVQPIQNEEEKLVNEVMSNTRDIDVNNPDSMKAALTVDTSKQGSQGPSSPSQGSAEASSLGTLKDEKSPAKENQLGMAQQVSPVRNFAKMAISLLAILSLFLGAVYLAHRYSAKLKKLPFGKKERLIQLVATHHLGNKKSISLVKITGEYMVVGVSNDNISLLSKLGPEVNVDKYVEDRFWGGTFEKHLDSYASDLKVNKEIELGNAGDIEAVLPAPKSTMSVPREKLYDGIRDLAQKTTDRVELSPVRASIKEKLTKLKPLA